MREYPQARQLPGEPRRRWFNSEDLDLVVWYGEDDSPTGFELCYDKRSTQRAVRWSAQDGLQMRVVDEGEDRPGKYKATPCLLEDANSLDIRRVQLAFAAESHTLPAGVAECVRQALAGEA